MIQTEMDEDINDQIFSFNQLFVSDVRTDIIFSGGSSNGDEGDGFGK